MRIGSIVIHCHQFERMVAFWSAALGYVPRTRVAGGWAVLTDPSGRGPNLSFQARETPARSRSWLHLDLYTNDQKHEVERLIGLGATRYPWRYRPGADFVVLADPDGNLFCVVSKIEPGEDDERVGH
jgi:catechol 2,3-dioxygenase-like lactoylglutathione lyase family enzyme